MYTLGEIAKAMQAELIGRAELEGDFILLTDSRTLTNPGNSIFFAIETAFNNGHHYIDELIKKGVRVFAVHKNHRLPSDPELHFLLVENSVQALQNLAAYHRNQYNLPVIGITGSNGKTIVKEWLLQLLGDKKNTVANPKSYNSQIGVPLSVWQINSSHQLGIFEAGISEPGQMEKLERIIQPNIGVLTHLGTAHNEGFDTPEQKIKEKLLLFQSCSKVYCIYNEKIRAQLKSPVLSFGFQEKRADFNISEVKTGEKDTLIIGHFRNRDIRFKIPFTDEASLENACLTALILLDLDGFEPEKLEFLLPVSMRMELKKGIHHCLLVNDSYSNDLHALSASLSFLKQQSVHQKLTVILSDIEESGLPQALLYPQIKNLLKEKQVARLLAIGPNFSSMQDLFKDEFDSAFFENTKAFLEQFEDLTFQDESILIKGARRFEFEKIVRKLEQESHGTLLEINLSAALKNLNAIKQRLPASTKVMAMVKAFAYGSGSYEMAKLLQHKVDYLTVAYADEGVALRQSGIQTPIVVLNAGVESFEQLKTYQLEPVLFSFQQLKSFLQAGLDQHVKIHLEIDTGMHRLGFTESEIPTLIEWLLQNKQLQVASVFSHLSASDESQYDAFTEQQVDLFKRLAQAIETALGYSCIKHISNTAAALRFNQNGLDMVRLGIGLYGIDPSGLFDNVLEPVFTLKTHISQIKEIKAHESVGYARKAISDQARRIGILALGYADGLSRALSNGLGGFWIQDEYAPIIGNVCMDMCMVDLGNIKCAEGDEAVLFGKDHPLAEIAQKLNTIPYEILTSISQRVKRVYVSE